MMITNYLELEPARAKSRNPEHVWDHPLWVMEEKLNGWRELMHFGRDLPRTYLTGRRVSATTGRLSEKGLLVPWIWPQNGGTVVQCDYTVLDGEVMPPGGSGFHDLAGFLNSDVDTVRANVERHGSPTYRVFDALYLDGVDIREKSQMERRMLLERFMRDIRNPLIGLHGQMPAYQWIYDSIVEKGGEGVVLKCLSGGYGEGDAWIKVKRYSTLDVIVTDFTAARVGRTGKYLGQIGAAKVSVYDTLGELVEVGQVSGMPDDVRLDMTNNRDQWINTVIEIAAQEWGQNRLLHPRFKRRRPDADTRHCTMTKLMQDLGQSVAPRARVVSGEQRELPL
jgi:ATP-dependent DNA ligase